VTWKDVPPGCSNPAANRHEDHLQVGVHGTLTVHEKAKIRPRGGELCSVDPCNLPDRAGIKAAHPQTGGHVKIAEPSLHLLETAAVRGEEFPVLPPFLKDDGDKAF